MDLIDVSSIFNKRCAIFKRSRIIKATLKASSKKVDNTVLAIKNRPKITEKRAGNSIPSFINGLQFHYL